LALGQGDLVKRIILMAVLGVGLALPALAHAVAATQPIYFWSSTADAVSVPKGALAQGNARVIRPSVIGMLADGSWTIDNLRWSGWGGRVARATGISNASNAIPNAAQGKRIKRPANVMLTNPGRFEGHEVYRCFTLTVPTFPASDERLCLRDRAGYHYFESTAAHLDDFLSPDRKVWCDMSSSPIFCATGGGSLAGSDGSPAQRLATLSSTGRLTTCFVAVPSVSADCLQNWDSGAPVLRDGQESESGGFRCSSAANGITCIVLAGHGANKGFVITAGGVARVGSVTSAPSVAASVANDAAKWQAIAARAGFPVYRPTQTLGLTLSGLTLSTSGCLIAGYESPRSRNGPQFGFDEPGDSESCGQPGIANQVAAASINGIKVEVLVQCGTVPKCTVKDGVRNGFLLFVPERTPKHYFIQLQSKHMSLARFLQVAKSFTKVTR
jgi:hypothetical protein